MARKKRERKENFLGYARIVELETNSILSDCLIENFNQLVIDAGRWVDYDRRGDLIHDCYLGLLRKEENGDAFELREGNNGKILEPKDAVYGYVKATSKSIKYHGFGSKEEYSCPLNTSFDEESNPEQLAFNNASTVDDIIEVENNVDMVSNLLLLNKKMKSYDLDMDSFMRGVVEINKRVEKGHKEDLNTLHDVAPLKGADIETRELLRNVLGFALDNNKEFEVALDKVALIKKYTENC